MRVAVCFWGICRSTDYTIESIENNIFSPLRTAGIDYDIFVHTYTLYTPYENRRAGEYGIQLKNTLWKLLKPTSVKVDHQANIDVSLRFEDYRRMGDPWEKDSDTTWQTFNNHIRALWSLKEVTKLWESSSNVYDTILYVRPDVRFSVPLTIEWLIFIQNDAIVIPNFQLINGVNDRFAIARPGSAKVYGKRFDGALEYSKSHQLHSEKYLSDVLKGANIKVHPEYFPFCRVRANGVLHQADLQ
jgi:hypothetical protein